uniref:Uncharacterized protein n=1 Tax=Heliothis virescens TaxID=7102 RepID=A0A2A4IWE9_HELVI
MCYSNPAQPPIGEPLLTPSPRAPRSRSVLVSIYFREQQPEILSGLRERNSPLVRREFQERCPLVSPPNNN